MAIAFPEPKPPLQINSNMEIDALNSHFLTRSVPASNNHNLLLASWNIANFGAQSRSVDALKVIAFIMKRFDLIAVQEINDDYRKFTKTVELMGDEFDFVMSDTAGNTERLAYVFNRRKVKLGKLFGEVALGWWPLGSILRPASRQSRRNSNYLGRERRKAKFQIVDFLNPGHS